MISGNIRQLLLTDRRQVESSLILLDLVLQPFDLLFAIGNFQLVRFQLTLKLSDGGARWVISIAPGLRRSRLRFWRLVFGLSLQGFGVGNLFPQSDYVGVLRHVSSCQVGEICLHLGDLFVQSSFAGSP